VRGAARKNEAWLSHTRLQGGMFMSICHEVGGRLGAQANDLLDQGVEALVEGHRAEARRVAEGRGPGLRSRCQHHRRL